MKKLAPMKKLSPEQRSIAFRSGMLAVIVLLLVTTAWINSTLKKNDVPTTAGASKSPAQSSMQAGELSTQKPSTKGKTGDYFVDFRADRETIRAEEIALLDAILSSKVDAESMADATEQKLELIEHMEQEFALEKTLIAKGFEDVAVIIRDDLVTIVVKKAELSKTDATRVLDAAKLETGEDAKNIKIISVP